MNVDIEGLDVRLSYLTHDARRIIEEYSLQRLNLYWQCKLMELTYNYSPTTIAALVKDKADKFPGHPPYNIIKEVMKFITTKKQHNHVVFSHQAMRNLYRLDRSLIVADYTVQLDRLSLILDKLGDEEMNEILEQLDRAGMNLLLIRMEEYLGYKERQRRDVNDTPKFKPVDIAFPSDEGKQLLKQTIEDLRRIKE